MHTEAFQNFHPSCGKEGKRLMGSYGGLTFLGDKKSKAEGIVMMLGAIEEHHCNRVAIVC